MKPRLSIYNTQNWTGLTVAGVLLALLLSACTPGATSTPMQSQPTQASAATTGAPTNTTTPTETVAPPTATISNTATVPVTPTTVVTATANLPAFNWLDMLDAQNGYGLDGQNLYRTDDGGQTWIALSPNIDLRQTLALLGFFDKDNGWATSIDSNMKSMLYKTNDGGQTWVAVGQ